MIQGHAIPQINQPDSLQLPIRAAQYVRMSTDNQKYSIENQTFVIADYATHRGFTVVQTYADHARSGLRFDTRPGLKQLIADVRSGAAAYEAILVFDVSRWGRFQDVDESAYYEFICKEAGIKVHYCAEPFENDGSFASTMQKYMKRAMAGEYSRDLSFKVFVGQCRSARMGLWVAGKPPIGFRRELVDESGMPKLTMEFNQRKNLRGDRVLLRLGPDSEVETVRRIFQSFVVKKMSFTQIAAALNGDQAFTQRGSNWTQATIGQVLSNELYCGNIVYNRRSCKLGQRPISNPPEMWIRRDGAVDAIVSPEVFAKAHALLEKQRQRMSDQTALDKLAALWREKGDLKAEIIDSTRGMPRAVSYRRRFGSLTAAYKLIGFPVRPRYDLSAARMHFRSIICAEAKKLVAAIEGAGGAATFDEKARKVIVADAGVVEVVLAQPTVEPNRQGPRWEMRWGGPRVRCARSDLTLVLRQEGSSMGQYYLLPFEAFRQGFSLNYRIRVRILDRVFAECFRHADLRSVASALLA